MIARWLAPEAHRGWAAYRALFALVAAWRWGARAPGLLQGYSTDGIVLEAGPLPLARWIALSPPVAIGAFALLGLSLLVTASGRATRPALLVFAACHLLLNGVEGLHVGVVDKLLLWHALLLAWAGASPSALDRAAVATLTAAANLAAGAVFATSAGEFWLGDAMGLYLVHPTLGGGPLAHAVGASTTGPRALTFLFLGITLAWPPLYLIRPLRVPLAALCGLAHLALALTLDLGLWSAALLCATPVLVPATTWARWGARRGD